MTEPVSGHGSLRGTTAMLKSLRTYFRQRRTKGEQARIEQVSSAHRAARNRAARLEEVRRLRRKRGPRNAEVGSSERGVEGTRCMVDGGS